jgi:Ca2+-binding RTX toxin-like protein
LENKMTFLTDILNQTYQQLSLLAESEQFWQVFNSSFGTTYNITASEILRQNWQAGDFGQLPEIEVISSNILGEANGAYATSTNKIYLSEKFLSTATLAALKALLLEEIGHYVDAQINIKDTAGDEGSIFSELVQGYSIDSDTLQLLKAENDQTLIDINGQIIEVEQQNFTGTNNGETIVGTSGDDVIKGLGGNDTLSGEGGNDQLFGGLGSDNLTGGTGADQFVLEYFNGSTIAQDQDLVSDFTQGQDQIDLRTIGISDFNTILIITNDDIDNKAVINTSYNNSSSGYYKLKINSLSKSQLQSSDFNFYTTVSNDTKTGTYNRDDLFGGLGDDILKGEDGSDRLFGEQGNDQLFGGYGSDSLYGGLGADQFVLEYFNGSTIAQDQDVVIDFTQGQDQIDLRTVGIGDYNTLLILLNDDINGNAVISTNYNNSSSGYYQLKINGLSKNQLQSSDFNFLTSVINDTKTGTYNRDDLFGGLGDDILKGEDGSDRLFGEQGNDQLFGGYGSDSLYGGLGADQFVLEYFNGSTTVQDQDVVIDFTQGQDQIDLRTIGISDLNTILILTNNDVNGNAVISTNYNNSSTSGYYQLKINGLNKNQLQTSNFNFLTSVVNDTKTGTLNRDDLFGGFGDDILNGQNGSDRLFGEQGDDRLSGGVGNDTLYGGSGNDTAIYSGTRAQYQITENAGFFTITDTVSGRDGIDTLYDLENLQFSDQIVNIGVVTPTITLSLAPSSVTEDGTTNLVYTFTRNGATNNALTINYTVGGTATFNTDYTQTGAATFTATTGTIAFAAGSSTATLTIDPQVDSTLENNETVALSLTTGTGYNIGTTTAVTGTITNDDLPAITLAVAPASVTEDGTTNLVYTFTRNGATTSALTVNYTVGGTATFNTDYTQTGAATFTGTTGTITFAAGSSTAKLTIDPTADTTIEVNETVTLNLTSGTGYNIGTTTTVTGTITNDDSNGSIIGTDANETFTTTALKDTIDAQGGNDTINSTFANLQQDDNLKGGLGTDTLVITGGAIADNISIDLTNNQFYLSDIAVTIAEIERFNFGSFTGNVSFLGAIGNDWIQSGTGSDDLNGGDGNDTLNGGTGADLLIGGTGNDIYVVDNVGDIIGEFLNQGTDTVQSSVTWVLKNHIENLTLTGTTAINGTGNNLNNTIIGNSGNNTLIGNAGIDTLTGNAGNDILVGGLGNDVLTGGLGADIFRFNAPTEGLDNIKDFKVAELDIIQVSASGFAGGLVVGTLAATQFISGAGITSATDSLQRFIYNTTNGALFYDADGNGTGSSALQIATLTGLPVINSSHIQIIA